MSSLIRTVIFAALAAIAVASSACNEQNTERRAREAAEKIQDSIPNRVAVALAQEASVEDVKQAQQALTAAKEYMGEINGKLDPVTVNAIQSFQRTHGLEDDGILDDETKRLLAEVRR